jgi:N6-L-threonylcarbamoyladenine synthase
LQQAFGHQQVFFPPLQYCTDNGAMIAYAGYCRLQQGQKCATIEVKPRWPLDQLTAL